ncbi:actin-like [Pecten maximus]|uniref:actin-like n=1 Tax=Pecten maximus TaxID=6579 RepID=UPI001458F0EA|nr:actin-like [Pecten maximus]
MDLSTLLLDLSDGMLIQPTLDSRKSVVIDLGTRHTKAGFAGEQAPCAVFPTAEAQWHSQQVQEGYESTYPDATETVLNYVFKNKLGIDSKDHSVLLGRSLPYVQQNQEKLVELLFEKFQVHSALLPLNNVLSLYSSGHLTGLVMELGAGTSYCVPICDGFPIKGFIMSSEVTGNKLTEFFMNLLSNRDHSFTPITTDPVLAETLKETVCSVAPNLFTALSDSPEVVYTLPDGTELRIGRERYQCPEALFSPNLIPCVTRSIPTVISDCIKKLDTFRGKSCTTSLVSNIFLSGGGSKLTNIRERVKAEVDKCLDEFYASRSKVSLCPSGYSSWLGGSVLCCHSNYNEVAISAEEYHEHGVNITSLKNFF